MVGRRCGDEEGCSHGELLALGCVCGQGRGEGRGEVSSLGGGADGRQSQSWGESLDARRTRGGLAE